MPTDAEITDILRSTRVIALVGWSPNPARASHGVARFLAGQGYRVIPVNPGQAGLLALGETVRGSLAEIAEPVDMVDIFRRSDAVLAVVQEAGDAGLCVGGHAGTFARCPHWTPWGSDAKSSTWAWTFTVS